MGPHPSQRGRSSTGHRTLTIGKYPSRHTVYRLRPGVTIDPFTTNDVTMAHFQTTTGPGVGEEGPSVILTTAMEHFAAAEERAAEPRTSEAAPDRMAHPAPAPFLLAPDLP
jgi:hypothetical protein